MTREQGLERIVRLKTERRELSKEIKGLVGQIRKMVEKRAAQSLEIKETVKGLKALVVEKRAAAKKARAEKPKAAKKSHKAKPAPKPASHPAPVPAAA